MTIKQENQRRIIISKISFAVTLTCFVFVSWQSIQCLSKYRGMSQGTRLNLINTANLPFPAITICDGYTRYNKTRLLQCGMNIDDYQNKGKWIGNQSCSDDPKELFESIVFKLEDFVESYKYKYFDNTIEEYSESRPKLPNKLWSATDNRDYGRCFTTIPTSDHIQYGIKSISLFLRMKNADVYIHTPENFVTAKENTESLYWHDAHLGKIYQLDIKHELFNMLDNNGAPCSTNNDGEYSQDKCANEVVEKESLEKFGCTTPFGLTKNEICQDQELGAKVNEIYTEKIQKHHHMCQSSCSFFTIMGTKTKDIRNFLSKSTSMVEINFKENIKVITSYHLYSGLSLIAEVGGYVGLFLGVSINQVTSLVEWGFNFIDML